VSFFFFIRIHHSESSLDASDLFLYGKEVSSQTDEAYAKGSPKTLDVPASGA